MIDVDGSLGLKDSDIDDEKVRSQNIPISSICKGIVDREIGRVNEVGSDCCSKVKAVLSDAYQIGDDEDLV